MSKETQNELDHYEILKSDWYVQLYGTKDDVVALGKVDNNRSYLVVILNAAFKIMEVISFPFGNEKEARECYDSKVVKGKEEIAQNLKAWIEAMESGKYNWGADYLHKGKCFCAVGVAVDLLGVGQWINASDEQHNCEIYLYYDAAGNQLHSKYLLGYYYGLSSKEFTDVTEANDMMGNGDNYGLAIKKVKQIARRQK